LPSSRSITNITKYFVFLTDEESHINKEFLTDETVVKTHHSGDSFEKSMSEGGNVTDFKNLKVIRYTLK